MKWAAVAAILLATAGTANSCGSTAPVDTSCGGGKGHWIEDDNGWIEKTHVTVRICVDDGGNVIGLEVD